MWRREWDSLFSFLYLRSVKGLTGYLIETAYLGIGRRIVAIVAVTSLPSVSSQIKSTNRNSVYKENGPGGVFSGNKKDPLPSEGSLMRLKRKATAARFCRSGKECLLFDRKPAVANGKSPYCGSNCGANDRARAERAISGLAMSI